jgi:hypothetical protein
MTYRMGRMLVTAAAAMAVAAGCARNKTALELESATARPDAETAGEIQVTRQAIQTGRDAIIADAMPFTEAQSAKFWPLYREYRNDVQTVNDRLIGILTYTSNVGGTFTDDEAKSLLAEYMRISKDKIEAQEKFVEKLQDVLPATQVTRLFQLENKMDAAVAYNLAGTVPLAKKLEP